ncbi:hypothetical protein V6N11_080905 [Hibiscus sabdariffa]|uniref:Uncharacterized protein n=1 Tax=Hibiscus sabdariffa TaxID=183260 RepID=A0ABR2QI98_9ROSI
MSQILTQIKLVSAAKAHDGIVIQLHFSPTQSHSQNMQVSFIDCDSWVGQLVRIITIKFVCLLLLCWGLSLGKKKEKTQDMEPGKGRKIPMDHIQKPHLPLGDILSKSKLLHSAYNTQEAIMPCQPQAWLNFILLMKHG